ncbi:MAG TPA: NAD(P)H-dependent oxidoreductase [Xanthobacteraceae bacterium]|nr:NAD(P)H-dependent oxidoreductase [Xanthobacteraceae bacterium]
MRVLVVHCHPVPESFNTALREAVLAGLAKAGHEIDLLDLHASGFSPTMDAMERRRYHEPGANLVPVAEHVARLKRADALVFVFPTWWYGPPAMLKGWLDRVLIPHETFGMRTGIRRLERKLTNIRLIAAVTTLGSPWWWWRWIGQPGRRILLDGVGGITHPRARRVWLALHSMDSASDKRRAAFLRKVEARFADL